MVFTLTPSGSMTTLYSFPSLSSELPGVVAGPKGELFGANGNGGIYGSVYELSPAGVEKTLYDFPSLTDGFIPSGVIRDAAGCLFGITFGGGDLTVCGGQGCGVVFQLDPNGDETTHYSFEGPPGDGEGPESNLLRGKDGSLYGTTLFGGGFGDGTAFKIDPNGTETVLCNFNGAGPSTVRRLLRTSKEVSTESPSLSTTPGRCTCWTRRETKPYSINSQRRQKAALQPERCFAIKPAISAVLRKSAATRTRFAAA
jgi:uncharacterized repeat protein (TIGR03803 family)